MHRRRAAAVLVSGVLAVAAAAGCSDDDSGGPGSAATSQAPSGDGSSSGSTSGPAAATGPELSTEHVTLHAPEGWKTTTTGGSTLVADPRDEGDTSSISVADYSTAGGEYTLKYLAREAISIGGTEIDLTERPTVEIAGVENFHVAGPFGSYTFVDQYGPSVDGASVTIEFQLSTLTSEKKRQALIDSVLASVEWTL